jgi:predicted RNase H-like nuclease
MTTRRTLLAKAGITLADDLGAAAEKAGIDGVLDAAAAARTARRIASGSARSLPDPPETLSDSPACAIWI